MKLSATIFDPFSSAFTYKMDVNCVFQLRHIRRFLFILKAKRWFDSWPLPAEHGKANAKRLESPGCLGCKAKNLSFDFIPDVCRF